MRVNRQVSDYFRRHQQEVREEIVALTCRMVRERTVNVVPEKLADFPYLKQRGEEYRVGAIGCEALGRWGIPFQVFERQKGRTNVVGKVGSGRGGVQASGSLPHGRGSARGWLG